MTQKCDICEKVCKALDNYKVGDSSGWICEVCIDELLKAIGFLSQGESIGIKDPL